MTHKLIIAAAMVLLLARCNNFLSETPDNRANLDSQEKLKELLVSAYPEANYISFCEAMSDNVEDNPSGVLDQRNSDSYFWKDVSATYQDTPEYYWNACYTAIASANHALEFIDHSQDPDAYNAQRGEALVARAYCHFMLVSLFAQTYNPSTASGDLGIPYVTKPEKTSFARYERGTVKSVYENIERDLLEGLDLISDEAYDRGNGLDGSKKFHFTKMAAQAFACRFYLFKKDYEKVIAYADLVFGGKQPASFFRPWNTRYKQYSYDELTLNYTKASEPANIMLDETLSDWARSYNAWRYNTGASRLQEIFNDKPLPPSFQYAHSVYYSSTGVYFEGKFREHFVRGGNNANTGLPYTIVPLFTPEEVLFNKAEAMAMLGSHDAAMKLLSEWLPTHILDFPSGGYEITLQSASNYYQHATTNQQVVLNCILAFRRVEFLHEGLRWFDILRHKIPVMHNVHGSKPITLEPDDLRRVLQIPREAISVGKLLPNPR
jgi:hypothetical protein